MPVGISSLSPSRFVAEELDNLGVSIRSREHSFQSLVPKSEHQGRTTSKGIVYPRTVPFGQTRTTSLQRVPSCYRTIVDLKRQNTVVLFATSMHDDQPIVYERRCEKPHIGGSRSASFRKSTFHTSEPSAADNFISQPSAPRAKIKPLAIGGSSARTETTQALEEARGIGFAPKLVCQSRRHNKRRFRCPLVVLCDEVFASDCKRTPGRSNIHSPTSLGGNADQSSSNLQPR